MKMNGSTADPYVAHPPAVAVPETLTLPVAAAIRIIGDVGGTAVIAIGPVARIVSRPVVIRTRCDRAADNGAAEQPGGDTDADVALGMGRCGPGQGRYGLGGDGSQSHQSSLRGVSR